MSRFIMRVHPDQDLYVEWSTSVDYIIFYGTRDELSNWLVDREFSRIRDETKQRLDRAAETGTSVLYSHGGPVPGSWDDDDLLVRDSGTLARADLGQFVEALQRGDEAAAEALVQPLEDDGESDDE